MSGFNAAHVAEIFAVDAADRIRRGSGYLISGSVLLTAWHLIEDSTSITLRFDGGLDSEWTVTGQGWHRLSDSDLAIVTIQARVGVPSARLGGFGERGVVLPGTTAGFPRWKLRIVDGNQVDPSHGARKYRELAQVPSMIISGANRRDGSLELVVPPPADDPDDPGVSPWEGMSGGPVFCQDTIVAVITDHHHREGLGRLAAVRLDRLLSEVGSVLPVAVGHLVMHLAAQIVEVGVREGQARRSAYREQVHDIAPLGGLRDRDAELQQMAEFSAGDDAYMHWQAPPWTGKTALMATFALNPPAGVVVVPFFITARFAGQTDSTAFTDAMLDQLSALLDQASPQGHPSARDAHRRRLMREASAEVAREGLRFVLLVDGLDEDTGAQVGSGVQSIASLLPKICHNGMKVIVAGRPHPLLPSDLAPDHPLRTCRVKQLAPSPYATELAAAAKHELAVLLAAKGEPLNQDIVGFITASGGGLTIMDLEELTGRPRYFIEELLGGVFGRTVQGRIEPLSVDMQHVYLFAHETLREQALVSLGPIQIRRYRNKIHAWAHTYKSAGWPASTPRYLLTAYQRMLDASGEIDSLVELACDQRRHDRMLEATGSDQAAHSEIESAMLSLSAQIRPDLRMLVKLSRRRQRLNQRNANLPTSLPAVWELLNNSQRAEELVRVMADPYQQTKSLASIIRTMAVPNSDRALRLARWAEQVAHTVLDPSQKDEAFADIAISVAKHDGELAEQIARGISDGRQKTAALIAAADAFADQDPNRAKRVLDSLFDPDMRTAATIAVAGAIARHHPEVAQGVARAIDASTKQQEAMAAVARSMAQRNPDGAERVARDINSPAARAEVFALLAGKIDETDHAVRLIDEAEASAQQVDRPSAKAHALASLTGAVARFDPERADRIRQQITDPVLAADSLARISIAVSDESLSRGYARTAESSADEIVSPVKRAEALMTVAETLAVRYPDHAQFILRSAFGMADDSALARISFACSQEHPGRAEQISLTIADPQLRAESLVQVALAVAGSDWDRGRHLALAAEQAARETDNPTLLTDTLSSVAMAIARADPDQAERVISLIKDSAEQKSVRTAIGRTQAAVAQVLAHSEPEQAEQLARALVDRRSQLDALASVAKTVAVSNPNHAIDIARSIPDVVSQENTLVELADIIAHHNISTAEELAWSIANTSSRIRALAAVASVAAATDPQHAVTIASRLSEAVPRARALIAVARVVAATDVHLAESVAMSISDPGFRDEALSWTARVAAEGSPGEAERIAYSISTSSWRAEALAVVAPGLARSDIVRATRAMRSIDTRSKQTQALIGIARVVAPTDLRQAKDLVDTITDTSDRANGLVAVVEAVAGSRPEAALDLASHIDNDRRRGDAQLSVVRALSGREADRAETVARSILEPIRRDRGLGMVVEAVAERDPARAMHVAQLMSDRTRRSEALLVAVKVLSMRNIDRAEELAMAIADPFQQAEALLLVAQGLADRDPMRSIKILHRIANASGQILAIHSLARHMAANPECLQYAFQVTAFAILVSANWSSILPVIPAVSRALLVELIDDLLEDWPEGC